MELGKSSGINDILTNWIPGRKKLFSRNKSYGSVHTQRRGWSVYGWTQEPQPCMERLCRNKGKIIAAVDQSAGWQVRLEPGRVWSEGHREMAQSTKMEGHFLKERRGRLVQPLILRPAWPKFLQKAVMEERHIGRKKCIILCVLTMITVQGPEILGSKFSQKSPKLQSSPLLAQTLTG